MEKKFVEVNRDSEGMDPYDIMNTESLSYPEEPGEEGLYPASFAGAAGCVGTPGSPATGMGSPVASMGSPMSVMTAEPKVHPHISASYH